LNVLSHLAMSSSPIGCLRTALDVTPLLLAKFRVSIWSRKSATHSNGTRDDIFTIVSLLSFTALPPLATLAIYHKQIPKILKGYYCEETRMPLQYHVGIESGLLEQVRDAPCDLFH